MRRFIVLLIAIALAGVPGVADAKPLGQHKDNPTAHRHGWHQHKDNPTKRRHGWHQHKDNPTKHRRHKP